MKNVIIIFSCIVAIVLGILLYNSSGDNSKLMEEKAQIEGEIKQLKKQDLAKAQYVDSVSKQNEKLIDLLEKEKKNIKTILPKYEKASKGLINLNADESILYCAKRLDGISTKDSIGK